MPDDPHGIVESEYDAIAARYAERSAQVEIEDEGETPLWVIATA
jgi:hypothetical protein